MKLKNDLTMWFWPTFLTYTPKQLPIRQQQRIGRELRTHLLLYGYLRWGRSQLLRLATNSPPKAPKLNELTEDEINNPLPGHIEV